MADEEVPTDLRSLFSNASSHVKSIVSKLNEDEMLRFYGLYKQATEGPCDKPKPSWYQMTEKQKWEAWTAVKTLDRRTAMEKYVALLESVDRTWRRESDRTEDPSDRKTGWVTHSVMQNDEREPADSEKTISDWVKEGNMSKILSLSDSQEIKIDDLTEDGLSLLHWAADRGTLDVVKYLTETLKADVDVRDADGQTPLHYASSCGHPEVVRYLLDRGADPGLLDDERQSPLDVASDPEISDMLKRFVRV